LIHACTPPLPGANKCAEYDSLIPVSLWYCPVHSGEQGVLVRDIKEAEENLKKAGADAAHAAGAEEEARGQGIILKRMGNKAGGGVTQVKDLGVIREMVQKLCQRSHPLAKSMDYLQEDLENMGKEFRFWQTERRVFADKLADEERLAGDPKGGENIGADLDSQIRQVRERTLGLKAQVMRNDETVAKLLQMAVSGTGR
ncbi:microtubule-binding protein MIP-T3-domain-containing protein, partial [Dunaliella salina]